MIGRAGYQQKNASAAVSEIKALTRLTFPLWFANIGVMFVGGVQLILMGRLGAIELGAVGLGNGLHVSFVALGTGTLLGLDPLIAQALGAQEPENARRIFWQGATIALVAAALLSIVQTLTAALLPTFGVAPETARQTFSYLLVRIPSFFFTLLFFCGRGYLQALGRTRAIVIGTLGNFLSLPITWLLTYGDAALVERSMPPLGIPALGIVGAGWAATTCNFLQFAAVAVAVLRVRTPSSDRRPPRGTSVSRALALGLPIGVQLLAARGADAIVGVLTGIMGAVTLAGFQAAFAVHNTLLQLPLALGAAAAVRVGLAVGQGDADGVRLSTMVSLGVAVVFGLFSTAVVLISPAALAGVISKDPQVIAAAVPMVLVVAAAQCAIGIQTTTAGALRGAGDTRTPLLIYIAGVYVVGLPAALLFTFVLGWGAKGLWWGMTAGVATAGMILARRLLRMTARGISRV